MGGWVNEWLVSLLFGKECVIVLEEVGYKVMWVDVDCNVFVVLQDLKFDVVFNVLYGLFGEDGCVQGILEFFNIFYIYLGVMVLSFVMNKVKVKVVMVVVGILVIEYKVVNCYEIGWEYLMELFYVFKLINEGFSFGVLIVKED